LFPVGAVTQLGRRSYLPASKRMPASDVLRHPLTVILLWHLIDRVLKWIAQKRRIARDRALAFGLPLPSAYQDSDFGALQACLFSAEGLLSLGRIEKRVLSISSLRDVMDGNEFLTDLVQRATARAAASHEPLILRYLSNEEKYVVLRTCMNHLSCMFGSLHVDFNAAQLLGFQNAFRSSWYCFTLLREVSKPGVSDRSSRGRGGQVPLEHRSRTTLRLMVVNETELRKIADGKLRPPTFGFFNKRHEARYRLVEKLARVFNLQLIASTPSSGPSGVAPHNPFTSEQVHKQQQAAQQSTDAGPMKRIRSAHTLGTSSLKEAKEAKQQAASHTPLDPSIDSSYLGTFLRLHIPHHVGMATSSRDAELQKRLQSAQGTPGSGGPQPSMGRLASFSKD